MKRRLSILVVEDDAEMCETLSDILSEEGYEVKTVGSGKEALAVARKEKKRFPICLIDLKLPDNTGIAVLKGLKALDSETHAIIITAFASKETAIEALKAGACCYIEKPLNIEELLTAIERVSAEHQLLEDKRRAEEELMKSEAKYKAERDNLNLILESMADGVYIISGDYKVEFMNKVLRDEYGDHVGESCYKVFHNREEPCPWCKYREVMKGKTVRWEWYSRRVNKIYDFIETPLRGIDGTISKLTIFRDISDRKRMEKEREQLIKELEAKNAEMERFIYTVSHDLRSPLVTIQGFADMLREDLARNDIKKVEDDLKSIKNVATKMEHLLNDTLELSRIGRVANPSEDVPFGELAQEALKETSAKIKSSGVEVSVADAFPTVHVDRMRIVEVLVNLIENSINYMGDNPFPKIEIGYRADGEEAVFFVRDNGIGIEPSQHEKVFELFYKVDRSSKGTGAGLAIVKRIIEVHGGRVWIESEKGKGCTVCFTLPVV